MVNYKNEKVDQVIHLFKIANKIKFYPNHAWLDAALYFLVESYKGGIYA